MSAQLTWTEAQEPTRSALSWRDFWVAVLEPLASLKLTVVLFGLAIFIVFAGTLAQVDKDIWDVIRIYFRAPIAWIEPKIFFPPSFFREAYRPQFPSWLVIPFPGGWMIGAVMALNLLAAHLVRFQVQARGAKLAAGSAIIAVGLLLTFLVVQSGSNRYGLQEQPLIPYETLWALILGCLGLGWLALAWRTISFWRTQSRLHWSGILATIVLGAALTWLFAQGDAARLNDSAMRIIWQLSKGSFAGIVLLIGCGMVFGKRAGIVLIHGGIGLMMFGELLVGLSAVEGQMAIAEGQSVNYVQDVRTWELAIVDAADPKEDQLTVIPKGAVQRALVNQQPIHDPQLPFQLLPVKIVPNAMVRPALPMEQGVSTKGLGASAVVDELPIATGTDSSGKIDQPAILMQVSSGDGKSDLGTFLFTMKYSHENIVIGDKTYHVTLRFKRTYKPYSIELKDFRKEDYLGTDTPRNYQADVVLKDPSRNVDREVKIWMNNPLRFAGETFYQSSFFRDEAGKEGTILSVVTNTGWLIPYVSCMIVAIGMLAHFVISLSRFLHRMGREATEDQADATTNTSADPRRRSAKPPAPVSVSQPPLGRTGWLMPLAVVAVVAVGVSQQLVTPKPKVGQFDFYRFGQIPIVADGRCKPLDTLARHTLLAISGKSSFLDANEERQPAVRWFLDMMAAPKVGKDHHVIRIENLEVQELLGLPRREGFRYSLEEVYRGIPKFGPEVEKAGQIPGNQQTTYQRKLLELEKKLSVFQGVHHAFSEPALQGDGEKLAQSMIAAMDFQRRLKQQGRPALAIPPIEKDEEWETYASGWLWNVVKEMVTKKPKNPFAESWEKIFAAYEKRDVEAFNSEVAKLHREFSEKTPAEVQLPRVDFEAYFNRVQPMTLAIGLYVTAFILSALGWLCLAFNWRNGFLVAGRMAFSLTAFTLVVHSLALISRMYISGRPPVTNLYSSAVFIGWGCVVLGLVLESVFRLGLGNVVATVAGYATLLIAHNLESDGSDTIGVMQAVLDTQFWLATHVTCISLGYATTYVAGIFGLIYILLGIFTPNLSPQLAKDLTKMNYGTLCFSIFFSFVGTVLGGLWADDSWGRFWGWDPKENGALMIVLWNALALHARWGGMVKERGLAVLAVAGNIVVSWSWFGVNALSVGLHAYAFDPKIFTLFCTLTMAHLPIIALGMIPRDRWWSRRGGDADPTVTVA